MTAKSSDLAEIAERLAAIGEQLADVALARLRDAADSVRDGGDPDPELTAEEKRITRARRSVEKAAVLLGAREPPGSTPDAEP